MVSIEVNDLFDDLVNENNRLLKELLFANKCLTILSEFKTFIELVSYKLNNSFDSNELQNCEQLVNKVNEVLNEKSYYESLTDNKESIIKVPVIEDNEDNDSQQLVDNFVTDEESNLDQSDDWTYTSKNKRPKKKKFIAKSVKKKSIEPDVKTESLSNEKTVSDLDDRPEESPKKAKHGNRETEPIPCSHPDCQYIAASKARLDLHMISHTDERPFVCTVDGCNRRYKRKGQLQIHLSDHSIVGYKCPTDGCEKMFGSREGLMYHRNTVHLRNRTFDCAWPGCDFKSYCRTILNRHKSVHCSSYDFACDEPNCSKKFKDKRSLNRHKATQHVEVRRYKCSWPGCHYACHYMARLKGHESFHTKERLFRCFWPNCGHVTDSKTDIDRHKRSHKGDKPYVCDWPGCNYRTDRKSRLKNEHMKKVHKMSLSVIK